MQKSSKKASVLVAIIMILILICIILKLPIKENFTEDLIFFKMWSPNNSNIKGQGEKVGESKNYVFDIKEGKRDIEFKNINLKETVNNKTLINEKIAPGTKGNFEIVINSNSNCLYQIKFKNLNQKPKNLTFQLEGGKKEYYQLEELEQELKGKMKRREKEDKD